MSTFHTSSGTRAQHCKPKYQSAPYRPSPARREAIYGRLRPMNEPNARPLLRLLALIFALIALWVVVR